MKKIPLTQGKFALVDDEDFEELSQYKWCIFATKYAGRNTGGRKNHQVVYMHREIMQPPKGRVIDHIDGNELNNQKSNLRICTRGENQRNLKVQKGRILKGVSLTRSKLKWRAYIQFNGVLLHLGHFATQEEAALAYNRAAILHFGEFAKLNDIKN